MKAKFISVYLSIVLLLVVCVSGTMAYFTDSTEAAANTIVSGNLDVELHYSLDDGQTWSPLTKDSANVLQYLPGVSRSVLVRISNHGDLSLKYEFSTLVNKLILGENDRGEKIDLSDYLLVSVADVKYYKTHEDFRNALDSADPTTPVLNTTQSKIGNKMVSGELAAGASQVFRMSVHLPNTVGNEANYRVSSDPANPDQYRPYIDIGLFVAATQATQESDSFGNDYDAGATVPTAPTGVTAP